MADVVDDGPNTDGCSLDFNEHADDELTASLRPLFPDGVPHDRWQQLWPKGAPS